MLVEKLTHPDFILSTCSKHTFGTLVFITIPYLTQGGLNIQLKD